MFCRSSLEPHRHGLVGDGQTVNMNDPNNIIIEPITDNRPHDLVVHLHNHSGTSQNYVGYIRSTGLYSQYIERMYQSIITPTTNPYKVVLLEWSDQRPVDLIFRIMRPHGTLRDRDLDMEENWKELLKIAAYLQVSTVIESINRYITSVYYR